MDRVTEITSVLSALPIPVLAVARSRRVLAMNGLAVDLFRHDATGAHYTTVLRNPTATAAIEETLSDSTPREVQVTLREGESDGLWRLDVMPMADDATPGVVVSLRDRTQELGLGQVRRDFVANVSHELKTPLTALNGFIDTLLGPAKGDAAAHAKFLTMMQAEAGRMDRLIAELLSLSRVESEARLRPDQRVDIAQLVQEAAETFDHGASDRGVSLRSDLPNGPIWVMGTSDQLLQVVRNLMENAAKYGNGQVELALTCVDHEPAMRGPAVLLDVRDDGDGIAAEHLPRLTERFYRVDTHRSLAAGGTGLGLAIVKHVVNRHRGRLRISSERGKGSTFTVVLPLLD